MIQSRFVGVDVNSLHIEVAVRPSGELWTTIAGEDGISEMADRLSSLQPELVVMEACGRFELPVAGVLATAGLPFALVPSRSIRDFARALGRSPRSDQQQASLLAQFAELVHPDPYPLSPDVVQQLRCLLARRRELVGMMAIERERVRLQATCPTVQKDVQSHIQFLDRAVKLNSEHFSRAIQVRRIM